jgi:two-component system sensor histidine kinase KdpD
MAADPVRNVFRVPPKRGRAAGYVGAALAAAGALAIVGLIHTLAPAPLSVLLLYVVPSVFAASRWGRGPAITAVFLCLLGHDFLFVQPVGNFSIERTEEALGLGLLLFTALVTAQLADAARRGAEQEREAAMARRADETKTALLRAVGHDLRTPLASIKAGVSGLRQSDATYSEEDRAELLAAIEEEADRLARLVNDLLDASKVQAGRLRPRLRSEDLGELVAAVITRLHPLLDGRELHVDVPADLPAVRCDYSEIDRVLANLLENAVRHTPPHTPIWVSVGVELGGTVRVEVRDAGPGVPLEDRERLFRAFERGPSPRSVGSGLGLAIARGFVEAHGGRLWAENAPGGGARFVFRLPVNPTEAAA